MASDATVLIFRSISNFVKDLNESFGNRQKSLLLYAALIEKTGLMHEEPIKKHIHLFSEFCKNNEEAITDKDVLKFKNPVIQYSEKVFIDIGSVFSLADKEEKEIMWRHLLTLLALLHPSSQAKSLLRQQSTAIPTTPRVNEDQFLSNLIDKVGEHIDPTAANPVEMMNGIMQSGVFQDLVSTMNNGLSDGQLDLTKMLGSLQTMIGNIGTMAECKRD